MKVTFDSFDELADWMNRKYLAYEELRDENRQLEMDRMKDSDRIAELEHELYTLKNDNGFLQSDCVPNMLKKKATAENSDSENITNHSLPH